MTRHLFIMLKEPHPGRVKTRLGKSIGHIQAAWWFRHQTTRLIRAVGNDPRWETVLCVSPDIEGLSSRVWPRYLRRISQGTGDLGDRMGRILRTYNQGSSLIIGADIPAIRPSHIQAAFAALGRHDAVFGPAPDGGFWLVGLRNRRAVPVSLFKNVRWSTENALNDSLKSLGSLSVKTVSQLRDVDTVHDL